MPSYILTIDQGTTGTTVLLLDQSGTLVNSVYSEFKQFYPQSGWVEHDAQEIWTVTRNLIKQILSDTATSANEITAIGITNQRETTVLWDRETGEPLYHAIVWQCRRTSGMCTQLKEQGLEPLFRERTGLILDAYFSGTKLKWLFDHLPGTRERAAKGEICFGTIDSWLIYKLTGGEQHVTDMTNASRTLLYNIYDKTWDNELLETLDIPHECLPEVLNSSAEFGKSELPELSDIPITGVAGDQQAALYGQNCWEPGLIKNTYGTGCFIVMNTGEQPIESGHQLLTTLACDAKGTPCYALEGSVFMAGAVVQWMRDIALIESAAETGELSDTIQDTNGVVLVPAFVGLGAPHWDSDARGIITGLTRGASREHIVRAGLESIAYQSWDVMQSMAADAHLQIKELRVDGGAAANDFLMQFQADLLNITVERPQIIETTAMGAAFLAGLGANFWTTSDIESIRKVERQFTPNMAQRHRLAKLKAWKNAVERCRSR
ncbi:MAG: glycerol kinase GlpK [candidate division KSB1 bacterium]|nr:glycerol kinase GlpK [candidate division KSB1 bacterium]